MKRKKIIEVIEIRSVYKEKIFDHISFTDIVQWIEKNIKIEKIILFKHKTIDTDFCLHIYYESENFKNDTEGTHLSSLLKDWSLVNYSIWTGEENFCFFRKSRRNT